MCLVVEYKENEVNLWDHRLRYLRYHSIKKIMSLKLDRGLPLNLEEKPKTCQTCIKSKKFKSTFDRNIEISTNKCLELLHMDLFGPN